MIIQPYRSWNVSIDCCICWWSSSHLRFSLDLVLSKIAMWPRFRRKHEYNSTIERNNSLGLLDCKLDQSKTNQSIESKKSEFQDQDLIPIWYNLPREESRRRKVQRKEWAHAQLEGERKHINWRERRIILHWLKRSLLYCNDNVMQSTLQCNYDYLVYDNYNYKIVLLLQHSHITKQGNENTITNLIALQG